LKGGLRHDATMSRINASQVAIHLLLKGGLRPNSENLQQRWCFVAIHLLLKGGLRHSHHPQSWGNFHVAIHLLLKGGLRHELNAAMEYLKKSRNPSLIEGRPPTLNRAYLPTGHVSRNPSLIEGRPPTTLENLVNLQKQVAIHLLLKGGLRLNANQNDFDKFAGRNPSLIEGRPPTLPLKILN
jgi:hypothetical protein